MLTHEKSDSELTTYSFFYADSSACQMLGQSGKEVSFSFSLVSVSFTEINVSFTFTFTFSHLADAFVQSDVQGREYSSYEQ